MPPNDDGPRGETREPADERRPSGYVDPTLDDPADIWPTIRLGWVRAGDSMPPRGSLAWRALGDDDPVKQAAELAEDLGATAHLRRHGPAVARALAVAP